MVRKVIIIHGYDSSPNTGWKPWLGMDVKPENIKVEKFIGYKFILE